MDLITVPSCPARGAWLEKFHSVFLNFVLLYSRVLNAPLFKNVNVASKMYASWSSEVVELAELSYSTNESILVVNVPSPLSSEEMLMLLALTSLASKPTRYASMNSLSR